MASSMVNNGSFGSEKNENAKVTYMQANNLHNSTSSPLTASSATQPNCRNDVMEAVGLGQLYETHAIEPMPPETKEHNENSYESDLNNLEFTRGSQKSDANETKKSLFCSFPIERVQTILSKYTSLKTDGNKMKAPRKVLCLYCDRTFVNVNLLQKHVERCHSSKQLRRVSLRKHQNFLTSTPCIYCDKFTSTEHTLKELFKHLVENHSNKYHGCLSCELRFLNSSHLADHNALCHNIISTPKDSTMENAISMNASSGTQEPQDESTEKPMRKKLRTRKEVKLVNGTTTIVGSNSETSNRPGGIKHIRNKKLAVKSSRIILKRSKRLQAKLSEAPKKRRARDLNEKKKKQERLEQNFNNKVSEKSTKAVSNFVNPYPEFDHFFQVKKITDHSIDNLKISSLTFDDVFDKAFFTRIKCNIQENLQHHIDGKLFKNEESESRISNFEKVSSVPQETQNVHSENYGCELSLNAIAPTSLLLSNQLGDDPESQIEYGSKPSKKKTQMKKDEVHYKYFTRRKYQASILEHKENRDLSKLDMWTQYVIKNRQQKMLDDKKSPKEILDYFAGEEYRNMMKREELNRILDRRGPFEDLKQEVSKKAALDKLNRETHANEDYSTEIGDLLNDIINRVFELTKETSIPTFEKSTNQFSEDSVPELPSYLNLRSTKNLIPENEIDRSDKIALICSSQETENFELPSNTVRGKDEKVELTGEWARSRMYVCAACGLKLQNIKQFLEHKSASHQYIWVQHYEFVGNQSELYRHLSIPILGKVGVLENTVQCKLWKRSDARLCTKCGKLCNSLGELHRHILECGGDWTWMLARKKCKYRPFGAKSRRKRRGLVKRIYTQKTEPSEKKVYKKTYDKPSDAETIKRMLANLPAKRATRKIISLKDGFNTTRTKQVKSTKQPKFKCGKLIRGKVKEQNAVAKNEFEKTSKAQNNNYRRSLRCLNKVLTSRILDTNSSIMVRRKYTRKMKKEQNRKHKSHSDEGPPHLEPQVQPDNVSTETLNVDNSNENLKNDKLEKEEKTKRSSPRIEKRLEFSTNIEKMNIKRFFPVKKKKKINNSSDSKVESNEQVLQQPSAGEEDISNSQLNTGVNLRKRKNESRTPSSTKTKKTKTKKVSVTTKIRKLKTKVKNIPAEDNTQLSVLDNFESNQQTQESYFLESQVTDTSTEVTSELGTTPIVDEPQDVPNVLETEKQMEHDKSTHINEVDSNCPLLPKLEYKDASLVSQSDRSVQTKRKLRRPTRGLNDCIAMLTSKLGARLEESTSHNIFNEEVPSQIHVANDVIKKPEYILKVPFSNEHFNLRFEKEDECLDLSSNGKSNVNSKTCVEEDKTEDVLSQVGVSVTSPSNDIAENKCDDTDTEKQNLDTFTTQQTLDVTITQQHNVTDSRDVSLVLKLKKNEDGFIAQHSLLLQSADETSAGNDGLTRDEDTSIVKEVQQVQDTDSEDELPLSNLLREEDKKMNENLDETETVFTNTPEDQDISVLHAIPLDKEVESQERSSVQIILNSASDVEIPQKESLNNTTGDSKLSKKKDVLMEINDNLCEITDHPNTLNALVFETSSNKTDHSNRKALENKLEDTLVISSSLPLPIAKSDPINETKDGDSSNPSETHCQNPPIPSIKFNFFTKNTVDDIAWKNAVNDLIGDEPIIPVESSKDDAKKNQSDTSDYKENSIVVVEEPIVKPKQKKKINKSCSRNKTQSQFKRSVELETQTSKRKSSRTAKTKALESILDDVLLELSENDAPLVKLKNVICEEICISPEVEPVQKEDEPNPPSEKLTENELLPTDIACQEEPVKQDEAPEIFEDPTINKSIQQDTENSLSDEDKTNLDNSKELRRSSRNSKRVTSYNETDLLDPLLDDIESDRTISKIIKETTMDIFGGKRKHRKLLSQKKVKNGQTEKKVNGDELFDLLKSNTNENLLLSKPTNTFFNTFEEISNEFNDDNFDVFEDILEKSIAVIEENLSEQAVLISTDAVSISSCDKAIQQTSVNADVEKSVAEKKKSAKKKSRKQKTKNVTSQPQLQNNISVEKNLNDSEDLGGDNDTEYLLGVESVDNSDRNLNEINQIEVNVPETKVAKNIYCDICKKSFSRVESLTKHKRTLTHISKLSELEAKEAAMKSKSEELNPNEDTETIHMSTDSTKDLNLLDMLGNMDDGECKQFSSPFTVNVNNSNLKLADIISDVLNKPMLKKDGNSRGFDEIIMQNDNVVQPQNRRCKSLAERKSFESEASHVKNVDYLESDISNAAAGTILEKQITLLENMIENRSSLGYIEELSVSSSVNENIELENEIEPPTKQVEAISVYSENHCIKNSTVQQDVEKSFLKPTQYEEISEDSNLRNYEEQKSRKVLNRDEELFLECCSLLKSGSEVSSYSKKSNNLSKELNNSELKRSDEQDWLESNCISQKEHYNFVESYSDSSRIRTPLGDNFSQEESNSATISSQWEVNNCNTSKKDCWKDNLRNKNLTFEKVFSGKTEIFCERNEMEELHTVVSSFDRVISEVLHTELDTSNENMKKDPVSDLEEKSTTLKENEEYKNPGVIDCKKMLTKGAMKVFEGLKVSIPTEELNMDTILTSGSAAKTQVDSEETSHVSNKTSKSSKRKSQVQNKSIKSPKSKHIQKSGNLKKLDIHIDSKNHDVYDFEETQDNSDVFTKPDFRSFRYNEKSRKTDKIDASDDDSGDYADTFGFDALSSSASSVSEVLPSRSETDQNITKKKYMIMGRIFKNAVKSKIVDEDIRNIPVIDNTKLVEDFVLNCPEPIVESEDKKSRMTEEEMNLAFDKLIGSKAHETKETSTKASPQLQPKSSLSKRKQKIKNKKRNHGQLDSSDDEFELQKYSKKRQKKKNNNSEESCINLEQELRECIGVASRKSQRKCTSGKQNVLMEYWSSDESSFEAMLEKQIIETAKKNSSNSSKHESNNKDVQESHCKEPKVNSENNSTNYDNVIQAPPAEVTQKKMKPSPTAASVNRRKRIAANPLYHWSSSSEDESRDLIEVRPLRDEVEDDEDRPVQHGWIVGDSPKKLVTMLAQAKGKKCDVDSVKEHGKKRTSTCS